VSEIRMAEVLGGLSLACDLADGFPPEKVLRSAVLAVELGRAHGVGDADLRDAYYATLLRYVGCTAFSHEEAHVYGAGDDIGTRQVMAMADAADALGTVRAIVRGVGAGGSPVARAQAVARLLGDGVAVERHAHTQCEASIRFAEMVGMRAGITGALSFICERWDGKGAPKKVEGEGIPIAMRLHQAADVIEIALHRDGRDAAIEVARRRSGGHLDPRLCQTFVDHARPLLDAIDGPSVWERFLACEPSPRMMVPPSRIDDVARAFAGVVDVKSVWTLGHSTGVAALVERAARDLAERAELVRAALLHDLGRLSVATGVWDKPGKLSVAEWERVRMHAYWTERVLWQAQPLRTIAQVAGGAHERLDGGGYHRAVPATLLAIGPRLVAAADAYQAMREARPYRPALSAEQAKKALLDDVAAGKLDREAVAMVLEAAGDRAPRIAAAWPRGLTDREVAVLRLLAKGQSNKQIARALDISAKTVQHHVAHVYAKIGCSSRARAALFATDHGLL
jgi:HD-GYP domain-containing protein (c-di-GMP phosphodiesterase class II)